MGSHFGGGLIGLATAFFSGSHLGTGPLNGTCSHVTLWYVESRSVYSPLRDANERNKALGYLVLRVCLGVNIAMHGFVRIGIGPGNFAASLVKQFQGTMLPVWSVEAFGYTLPWVEAVLGLLVLAGFRTNWALVAGGLVIAVLTFGITLVQQWAIAGTQLVYGIAFGLLLFLVRFNDWSVDGLLQQRRTSRGAR